MVKSALIFIPDTLNTQNSGYLEGVRVPDLEGDAYYVLSDQPCENPSSQVGYYSKSGRVNVQDFQGFHLHRSNGQVTLSKFGDAISQHPVKVVYDYKGFLGSACITSEDYGHHFNFLSTSLKKTSRDRPQTSNLVAWLLNLLILLEALFALKPVKKIIESSSTLTHFVDGIKHTQWFVSELNDKRRLTPALGSFILARLIDVTLGLLVLYFLILHQMQFLELMDQSRETIINELRSLLSYLMGSPIGLKLNHAFNQSLGTFFFYHISLWRIFLLTMHPFLLMYFKVLILPGVMGLSYQVALLSDLISIATFHCYCIYVYAARALSIQLKGLLSLWRLFIGRKYNPLRQKVDSYKYNQNQLFVGTSTFTIFLFLLPTTTMYYAVFVCFRIVVVLIGFVLKKIRIFFCNFPLYVVLLHIFKSPQMKGTVRLKWFKSDSGEVNLRATLKVLPLGVCMKRYGSLWIEEEPQMAFGNILHKIFTGSLI